MRKIVALLIPIAIGCGGGEKPTRAPTVGEDGTGTERTCPDDYQMYSNLEAFVSSEDRAEAKAEGGLAEKKVEIGGGGEAIYFGSSTDEWICLKCPAGTTPEFTDTSSTCKPIATVSVDNSHVGGSVVGGDYNDNRTTVEAPPPPPSCPKCQRWDEGARSCVSAHRVTSCGAQDACNDAGWNDGPGCQGEANAAQQADCWSGGRAC